MSLERESLFERHNVILCNVCADVKRYHWAALVVDARGHSGLFEIAFVSRLRAAPLPDTAQHVERSTCSPITVSARTGLFCLGSLVNPICD